MGCTGRCTPGRVASSPVGAGPVDDNEAVVASDGQEVYPTCTVIARSADSRLLMAGTLAGFQDPVLLDVDLRADNSPTPPDDLEQMLALRGRAHPAPAEVVPRTEVPHRPEDEGLWPTVLS